MFLWPDLEEIDNHLILPLLEKHGQIGILTMFL